MKNRFGVAMTLMSCVVGCAGADPAGTDESVGESTAQIVRADRDGGPESSVAVVGLTVFGGHRYCSGVVVAPRVYYPPPVYYGRPVVVGPGYRTARYHKRWSGHRPHRKHRYYEEY